MKDTIEIYTDNSGFFRFRFKGGTDETLVTSEAYRSKDEALKNLESIRGGAASEPVVDCTGN